MIQNGGAITLNASTNNNLELGCALNAPANKTAKYTLVGGSLSLQGAGGNVNIGGSADGTGTGTFVLTNSGKLLVSGSISGYSGAAATSEVFTMSGGTLVAFNVNMTNLSDSATDPVGTFVNNGGTLAPGGPGTPGVTIISGAYSSSSNSTLAVDINGPTPANAFQNNGAPDYDNVTVSGGATLGGSLSVSLNNYTPAATSAFPVLTAAGGLTSSLNNVTNNRVLVQGSTNGSFQVLLTATSLILTNYSSGIIANSAPTNVVAKLIGPAGSRSIVLTGAGGSGASYSIWTTTNLTKSGTIWTSLASGQAFGTGGSVNFTNAINSGIPIRFFQIRVP